jgi:hypothetical protein
MKKKHDGTKGAFGRPRLPITPPPSTPGIEIPDDIKTDSRLYHYTPLYRAIMILREGTIRLATHGPAFLWLSSNPHDELTSCGAPMRGLGEAYKRTRFVFTGVPAIPFHALRIREFEKRRMIRRGIQIGARPSEWFALTQEAACAALPLELQEDDGWQPLAHAKALERYREMQAVIGLGNLVMITNVSE